MDYVAGCIFPVANGGQAGFLRNACFLSLPAQGRKIAEAKNREDWNFHILLPNLIL